MANFSAKCSIMTQEMVDSFCESFYILAEVHPIAPGRDKTIAQFPAGEVGVYTRIVDVCGYRIPYGLVGFYKTANSGRSGGGRFRREMIRPGFEGYGHGDGWSVEESDVLPAKKLRTDHPSLASDTRGKTLAGLDQIMPAGSRLLAREQSATPSVAPPQESESFVDLSAQASLQIRTTVGSSSTLSAPVDTAAATTTSTKAKLAADVNPDLAGPSQLEEWNITNDSLLDDGVSCRTLVDRVAPPTFFSSLHSMDCDQLYTEFNVGAARQICLGSEVRSRAEHELELKEKLNAKYAARGKLLEEKDSEILRLKSQLAEKEAEAADVVRLRDQVSLLFLEEVCFAADGCSALRFLLCVLVLRISRRKWKFSKKSRLRRCTTSTALGRAGAVDFGMQEGLEAGHEHGVARSSLFVVDAYNPEVASAYYVNAVKALEDAHFPLVDLLKSKKDVGMDEVLDCFLLDGPLAELPEAASLQPCIEQLSIPIHHAGDKTAIGETSLSFALMNVHARAEGGLDAYVSLRPMMKKISPRALCLHQILGGSTSAVWSVGIPISAGMTASVPFDEKLLKFQIPSQGVPRVRSLVFCSISM
ncbi:hypothetical protein Tco_0651492 [Tanacetum coccineum]|uniref:Uncharacterized protein n=1 Tax=Tanacetum coccineum TaxID=301880 RepID=A0ABQ4WV97_9ASTR